MGTVSAIGQGGPLNLGGAYGFGDEGLGVGRGFELGGFQGFALKVSSLVVMTRSSPCLSM